jgi:hypothetical protein
MTRSFHQAVRLAPRRPKRLPRKETLSFTCFRLVKNWDREPGESEYSTVELTDATNAMKSLVVER